jgi:acyl-CoA-binding protein
MQDRDSPLHERFTAAAAASKALSERPDNATLLKLYSLYKQASEGDVEGRRPAFTDLVGRAKYDAWAALTGMESDSAKERYSALVESLQGS